MLLLETGDMYPPYYIVPDVERYHELDPKSDEAKKLARKIAANIGDYASLRLVLGVDPPEFACFYPDMHTANPSTTDTIDAFLEKFGEALPLPDVLSQLQNQDSVSQEISLENLLREQKYQEALELIEHQNLINPHKSIYFAHQMRFLRKLIKIQNYKNRTQTRRL